MYIYYHIYWLSYRPSYVHITEIVKQTNTYLKIPVKKKRFEMIKNIYYMKVLIF